MSMSSRPDLDDPDTVPRSVVGLAIELASLSETEPHRHRKAQLLYVVGGVITVEAAGGIWTVPPHCAIWIPSGIEHVARTAGRISAANLYVDPGLAEAPQDQFGILFVQPLLRELILRFVSRPSLYPEGDTREARLVSDLLDELQAAPLEPLHLPMPTERRLRRLVETLVDDPALRFIIEEWRARGGEQPHADSSLPAGDGHVLRALAPAAACGPCPAAARRRAIRHQCRLRSRL